MPDQFELMQELDKLSELKEVIDPKYIPIIEARICFTLQKAYKEKEKSPYAQIFRKEREKEYE